MDAQIVQVVYRQQEHGRHRGLSSRRSFWQSIEMHQLQDRVQRQFLSMEQVD